MNSAQIQAFKNASGVGVSEVSHFFTHLLSITVGFWALVILIAQIKSLFHAVSNDAGFGIYFGIVIRVSLIVTIFGFLVH